jgi:hypothetical protein
VVGGTTANEKRGGEFSILQVWKASPWHLKTSQFI